MRLVLPLGKMSATEKMGAMAEIWTELSRNASDEVGAAYPRRRQHTAILSRNMRRIMFR